MNTKRNIKLVVETILVFIGLCFWATYIHRHPLQHDALAKVLFVCTALFQGFWFYRFYIVGHEASHRKLFIASKTANDIVGSIILLPLMTPITVYRKIHLFHHGFNRKDNHTSALDTFTTKNPSLLKKIYYHVLWYISVFFGGLFIHSLVSVILFLFIPPRWARKISPAFEGWTLKDQFQSILLFSLGVGLHLAVYFFFGWEVYLWTMGYPMIAFAWILSLFVYIFHYDTTVGDQVRFNVRSVNRLPFFSWVLMNFNEHATHHQHPNIPWYELPEKRTTLPKDFADKNQNTWSLFSAIFQQIKGPRIIDESKD
ncbi:fatty acid desaturase family protein [Lewinella cohaerens]|uniref:fatty acid desaturase family protein n=1 Tax=Lewinella cohaerens TaxID=70995 RepID=UPI00037BF32C|nr:fatty acid desaturase [Lewinella cohaerens]